MAASTGSYALAGNDRHGTDRERLPEAHFGQNGKQCSLISARILGDCTGTSHVKNEVPRNIQHEVILHVWRHFWAIAGHERFVFAQGTQVAVDTAITIPETSRKCSKS